MFRHQGGIIRESINNTATLVRQVCHVLFTLTSIIKVKSLTVFKLHITQQQCMSTLLQQQYHTAMSLLCYIITAFYISCAVNTNIRIIIGDKGTLPGCTVWWILYQGVLYRGTWYEGSFLFFYISIREFCWFLKILSHIIQHDIPTFPLRNYNNSKVKIWMGEIYCPGAGFHLTL